MSAFLSSSMQIMWFYQKSSHESYLPHLFKFRIHKYHSIWCCSL